MTSSHRSPLNRASSLKAEKLPVDNGLGQTFITSLLLTANLERAERAMLEAIGSLAGKELSPGTLLEGSIKASIAISAEGPADGQRGLEGACSVLPPELCKLLYLPRDLRQCYVLRILAGLSWGACASLLKLDIEAVEELTCAALVALARGAEPLRVRRAAG